MSKEDHLGAASAAASPAQRTGPAAEARDRLARHEQRLREIRPLAGFGHERQSQPSIHKWSPLLCACTVEEIK